MVSRFAYLFVCVYSVSVCVIMCVHSCLHMCVCACAQLCAYFTCVSVLKKSCKSDNVIDLKRINTSLSQILLLTV